MKQLTSLLAMPLCALILMAAAPKTAPDTPATIAADLEANPPADPDSFYAIRTRLGDDGFKAVGTELNERLKLATKGDTRTRGCVTPQWYLRDLAGLQLARAATSDTDWAISRDQVVNAIAQRAKVHDQVMAGQKIDPAYDHSAVFFAARATTWPAGSRARELGLRAAEDQFQRNTFQILDQRSLWAAGLTPSALAYMTSYNDIEMCRVDLANTEWLKADVAAHGWPKQSVEGKDPVNDAWTLIQHADHDVAFQRQVLALMEPLLATKDVTGQEYAYLYDRVAVNSGEPSRYGTQGECNAHGVWEAINVEDPANLDARRASLGLGPEAPYAAHFKCAATK